MMNRLSLLLAVLFLVKGAAFQAATTRQSRPSFAVRPTTILPRRTQFSSPARRCIVRSQQQQRMSPTEEPTTSEGDKPPSSVSSSSDNNSNNEDDTTGGGLTRTMLLAIPLFCKFVIVLIIKFLTDAVVFPLLFLYRFARITKRKIRALFTSSSKKDDENASPINGEVPPSDPTVAP